MHRLLVLVVTCGIILRKEAAAFEPFIVGTAAVVLPSVAYYVYPTVMRLKETNCYTNSECCAASSIPQDVQELKKLLDSKLHGQHIAKDRVLWKLRAHVAPGSEPKKPLSLAFHGWTGGGKNHLSDLIVNSFYKLGSRSKYVYKFSAEAHFPHSHLVDQYKMQLAATVKQAVMKCPHSLFLFDEVHRMPPGVLDVIRPFLDYNTVLDGVDYRRTIFLFLSNDGGKALTQIAQDHWSQGGRREDLTLSDIEMHLQKSAWYSSGGFQKSTLMESHLISAHIPFLPLEKSHVKLCIEDALWRHPKNYMTLKLKEDLMESVLKQVPFDGMYSLRGCKLVQELVEEHLHSVT